MIKIDPIIAVRDVQVSSKWYEFIFACKRTHGGEDFAVLKDEKEKSVLLCLHKWGEHNHPSMENPKLVAGNGLILYFRTHKLEDIRQKVKELNHPVVSDIHLNSNSTQREFSMRDLDGYFLIISEYHEY